MVARKSSIIWPLMLLLLWNNKYSRWFWSTYLFSYLLMLIFKPKANGYKAYWVLNIKPRKYDILFKNFQQDRTTTTHSHQVGKATSDGVIGLGLIS